MVKMEFTLHSLSLMNSIWRHSGEGLSWDSSFWMQEQREADCDTRDSLVLLFWPA